MPCQDITESLIIELDTDSRVVDYCLEKMSCGGAVGYGPLLIPWLCGKKVEDILTVAMNDVMQQIDASNDLNAFLITKHLIALQSGLAAMLGRKPSGNKDACQIVSIESGPNGTKVQAKLKVDLLVQEIEACQSCC